MGQRSPVLARGLGNRPGKLCGPSAGSIVKRVGPAEDPLNCKPLSAARGSDLTPLDQQINERGSARKAAMPSSSARC